MGRHGDYKQGKSKRKKKKDEEPVIERVIIPMPMTTEIVEKKKRRKEIEKEAYEGIPSTPLQPPDGGQEVSSKE